MGSPLLDGDRDCCELFASQSPREGRKADVVLTELCRCKGKGRALTESLSAHSPGQDISAARSEREMPPLPAHLWVLPASNQTGSAALGVCGASQMSPFWSDCQAAGIF